ncbi:MAG: DUF1643 domain-containing protein [Planctomycetes bacterium]|nr:DUF1643 domain-containing protein [Planctomycetota bacterium]
MTALPLEQNAVISACGKYRYVLTRQVGPGVRTATFIMLNPSTADAMQDDPTIRRCIGFAQRWGCGRLAVLNLFAFRATDPADLKRAEEPVGPDNRAWFDQTLLGDLSTGPVVCGWGVHGEHRDQDLAVLEWLKAFGTEPLALGLTKDGHPRHPLYVPYAAVLVPFTGRKP